MLKLFYTPHTCALASHIALEEVGAEHETALIISEPTGGGLRISWRSTRKAGSRRW